MRRTSAAIKAAIKSSLNKRQRIGNYGFPREITILKGTKALTIPIKTPRYRSKIDLLKESNTKVFVELTAEYINWLYSFVNKIMSEGESKSPYYNPKLDYITPGISAFRVYDSDLSFFQVGVSKVSTDNHLFQLDYYECESGIMVPKLIIICDISDPKETVVDIAFGGNTPQNSDYACKLCSAFRALLIYLRPWEYSMEYKNCSIYPYPNSDKFNYLPELPRL